MDIPNQVKLSPKVALEVVLQGIRIRFGRSVVTVMGVVFGIAFLMSILVGQSLKEGVAEEDAIRGEVTRMMNFLSAEMGPAKDRTVAVEVSGQLNLIDQRFLQLMGDQGLKEIRVTEDLSIENRDIQALVKKVSRDDFFQGVSGVLLLGDQKSKLQAKDFQKWQSITRQTVVAYTGNVPQVSQQWTRVKLSQEVNPEEAKKMEEEKKKSSFRNQWIVIISLLVTVIGITNAMLMSVTERFREIGTMKCLGALSSFVRTMFLIESGIMGVVGGFFGCLMGALFSLIAYGFTYGFGLTFQAAGANFAGISIGFGSSLLAGILLSILAALYPAQVASSMVPATALRSSV